MKQEYNISSSKEWHDKYDDIDVDMVYLSSEACEESLSDKDRKLYEEEIEDYGEEQIIQNLVGDWLNENEW